MKTKLIFLLAIISVTLFTNVYAQDEPIDLKSLVEMDADDELIMYREVIEVVATPQEQYDRAIKWINDEFKNPLNIIKEKDPKSFTIVGKESFRLFIIHPKTKSKQYRGAVSYRFKLEFKDNRYRYTFYDFKLLKTSDFPLERWLDESGQDYNVENAKFLEQVNDYILDKILSLESAIKPETKEEDDW